MGRLLIMDSISLIEKDIGKGSVSVCVDSRFSVGIGLFHLRFQKY